MCDTANSYIMLKKKNLVIGYHLYVVFIYKLLQHRYVYNKYIIIIYNIRGWKQCCRVFLTSGHVGYEKEACSTFDPPPLFNPSPTTTTRVYTLQIAYSAAAQSTNLSHTTVHIYIIYSHLRILRDFNPIIIYTHVCVCVYLNDRIYYICLCTRRMCIILHLLPASSFLLTSAVCAV